MNSRSLLTVLATIALVAAACGGTTSADESLATTSSTAALTTTTGSPTTVPTTTSTTAVPPTTTTTLDPDAWSVAGATFVAGQCFGDSPSGTGSLQSQAGEIDRVMRISAGVTHPTRAVPCDGPHAGEVVATGSACPIGSIGETIDRTHLTKGIDPGAMIEATAQYVGVDADELSAWLTERGLVMRFRRQADDDMVITDTMCAIGAVDGDLTRSYRATG